MTTYDYSDWYFGCSWINIFAYFFEEVRLQATTLLYDIYGYII